MKTETGNLETDTNGLDAMLDRYVSVDTARALVSVKELELEPVVRDSLEMRSLVLKFLNWYLHELKHSVKEILNFRKLVELQGKGPVDTETPDVLGILDIINSHKRSTHVFPKLVTLVYGSEMEEILKLAVVRRMVNYTNGEMVHAMLPDSLKLNISLLGASEEQELELKSTLSFTRDKTVQTLTDRLDVLLESKNLTEERKQIIENLMS